MRKSLLMGILFHNSSILRRFCVDNWRVKCDFGCVAGRYTPLLGWPGPIMLS